MVRSGGKGPKQSGKRHERITCRRGKSGTVVMYVAKFLLFIDSQTIWYFYG